MYYIYSWVYTQPSRLPNLAYGKNNWLEIPKADLPHAEWHYQQLNLYVSRYIDGDHRLRSGFSTRLLDNPAWVLDLSEDISIKIILLYEDDQISYWNIHSFPLAKDDIGINVNVRPLKIDISSDGNLWIPLATIKEPINSERLLTINLNEPAKARFIKIRATDKSKLSFDEIEVYGNAN